MKEQFCTYDISLKLKALGFDEECLAKYDGGMDLVTSGCYTNSHPAMLAVNQNDICEAHVLAPLWQQCAQWLRETYSYHISVYRLNNKWCGDVYDVLRQCYITSNAFDSITYSSYEEAREQAILKAIELCKQ